ncbi:MAG: phosphatase PAP2 family protein [Clostridiales bacterium]|nr:phosphatase PAP2 family protein [Clostridiales bacterium]
MKNKKSLIIINVSLILLSILFTILVKFVGVGIAGDSQTSVGFASINQFVFDLTGVNMIFYHITDWMGFIPVFVALAYMIIGIIQWIKRKKLTSVDKEIFWLGAFYILIFIVYVFFEKVVVNYRPVFMDGYLEPSYPSSHTLMAICILGSSFIVNKKLYNNKASKICNIISIVIMTIIVVGRFISGVHWFTDIIGGILISSALLMTLYNVVNITIKQEKQE